MSASDNKRIARNTLLLYCRMLLTMAISLYTSRVVLAALGVNDYGIYNVVGGFVAMFSVISGSLSAGISRFITYELGRGSEGRVGDVFSTSLVVQLILGGIIVLLAESVGLWFLNYKLNIDSASLTAANWVYQCSILTFLLNLISVPYNAAIIAHEKMSAFAYISIIEVAIKLFIAFIISWLSGSRLIIYAILILMSAVVIRSIYARYCTAHFAECKTKLRYDKAIFKEIASFSGWNFIGSTSGVLRDQGVNILMNIFFGTVVNAARGIAIQVNSALASFSSNFVTALNPQIIKLYAAREYAESLKLVYRGSKFAFFIMFMLALPILFNTELVLSLWLKAVPDYTVLFTQLAITMVMIEIISYPLMTLMQATGNIRNYQLVVGGIQIMNFPLSYIAYKLGMPPQYGYYIAIFLAFICLGLRLIMLKRMTGLSITLFCKGVLSRIIAVAIISSGLLYVVSLFVPDNLFGFVLSVIASLLITGITIMYIGCDRAERTSVLGKIQMIYNKIRK